MAPFATMEFWTHCRSQPYSAALFDSVGFEINGEVFNLATRLIMVVAKPPIESRSALKLTSGPFRITSGWLSVRELETALTADDQDSLELGGASLKLRTHSRNQYDWRFEERGPAALREVGWHAMRLQGTGESQIQIAGPTALDTLDRNILAWSYGYFANLNHLRRKLGRTSPLALDNHTLAHVEVYAPTYVRLSPPPALESSTRQLTASIECHDPARYRPMLFVVHDDLPRAIQFNLDEFRSESNSVWKLETTLPALGGPFDLSLLVGGSVVQTHRVGLPTLAGALHSLIDTDWKWLSRLLAAAKDQRASSSFEHYVVALLQLLGIPAVHYGQNSLDHMPDILAEINDGLFLVGECKVTAPTTQVVETLSSRALSLEQGLWSSRRPRILRVLFHARPAGDVNPDVLRVADENQVMIVDADQLKECQGLVQRGEPREVVRLALLPRLG